MKRSWIQVSERGFFTLLGLLLAIVIIFILYYTVLNIYFRKPFCDEKTYESLSEQDIDTSTRQAILDSTKKEIQDINRKLLNREKEIEK